jgi:hydroxyacyl-ACP dehydratase HTD2-like protein with hotdog domain
MGRLNHIAEGELLPEIRHETDTVGQFLYNAALWNAHRIHFDYPYATEVEGYPGLVVAGPLMGDWLAQCVEEWLGEDGRMVQFEYSNRRAAFVGGVLLCTGKISEVDKTSRTATITLELLNESGDVLTPGRAVVQFSE